MSRTLSTLALHAPSPPVAAFVAATRRFDWTGIEPTLARALSVIGDCARIAWWDGSAVGLHLNGLLGLFETEASPRGRDRA